LQIVGLDISICWTFDIADDLVRRPRFCPVDVFNDPGEMFSLPHPHRQLNQNALIGTIPESIGKLSKLKQLFRCTPQTRIGRAFVLMFSHSITINPRRFDYNQLSGTMPSSMGNLVDLETLFMNNNQLTGTVPRLSLTSQFSNW
jgi:hypothetical protein